MRAIGCDYFSLCDVVCDHTKNIEAWLQLFGRVWHLLRAVDLHIAVHPSFFDFLHLIQDHWVCEIAHKRLIIMHCVDVYWIPDWSIFWNGKWFSYYFAVGRGFCSEKSCQLWEQIYELRGFLLILEHTGFHSKGEAHLNFDWPSIWSILCHFCRSNNIFDNWLFNIDWTAGSCREHTPISRLRLEQFWPDMDDAQTAWPWVLEAEVAHD